jgi:hypothetical protein
MRQHHVPLRRTLVSFPLQSCDNEESDDEVRLYLGMFYLVPWYSHEPFFFLSPSAL